MNTQRRKVNNIRLNISNENYTERQDNTRVVPIVPPKLVLLIERRIYESTKIPLRESIERINTREHYEQLRRAREESKRILKEIFEKQQAEREAKRREEDAKREKQSAENKRARSIEEDAFWKNVETNPDKYSQADRDFLKIRNAARKKLIPKILSNPLYAGIGLAITEGISSAWFGIKDRLGSAAISSIKVNGDNINSRIGFNDMHKNMALAHEYISSLLDYLTDVKKQKDEFIRSTGYSPEVFALNPLNKQLQDLLNQYNEYNSLIKSLEWQINADPQMKSLDDAYKQLYSVEHAGFKLTLKNYYHLLADLTTYDSYKDYVAEKRMNLQLNLYNSTLLDRYLNLSGEEQLKYAGNTPEERLRSFDNAETLSYIKQLNKEREDLLKEYIANREHLAESTEYWKVRESFKRGEEINQGAKLWDWDYWSFEVPTMIGSSASSSAQGLSMGIQMAAAAAGVAESALGAPYLAPITMLAAQVATTPLDFKAMYDENYAETGMKRINNLEHILKNNPNISNKEYKEIMQDLKTKSYQYWLDRGLDENYLLDYLLGSEGDQNVLRELVSGLINSTNPQLINAMIQSTTGLEAQLQTNNVRTGAETVVQKLMLTPGLGKLKRAASTMTNSIGGKTVEGLLGFAEDLSRGKIVFDNAGRATMKSAESAASGSELILSNANKYSNGFRRAERTLSESVSSGAKAGATIGDMLGLGIVGEAVGSATGGAIRGVGHITKELMPTKVRNVFNTMQEGFARKYMDIYDRLMPTKEWKKLAIKYGYDQLRASTVSGFSETAEEAVQYLNEKENFASKYGWNKVNWSDLLLHDFKQGGRVLNSYMSLLGLSESELLDDSEYWANAKGGGALGFLHNAVIGAVGNIREASTEAKTANALLRASIMNRELDKIDRASNAEIARQAMSGKGSEVIDFLQRQYNLDSRRATPKFFQEDYDEKILAALSIIALTNNKNVKEKLRESGILYGTEEYAIAIADMYATLQQLTENMKQYQSEKTNIDRFYNGVSFPILARNAAEQALAMDPYVDLYSEEEKEIWKLNFISNVKELSILHNRLSALVNLRAKYNSVEDFFESVSSKFGIRAKRPDAKIIESSIDQQIKDVIAQIKQIDEDFDATTDDEILQYILNNRQAIAGMDLQLVENAELWQAMLIADMDVISKHSKTLNKENYKRRIDAIMQANERNKSLDWLVNDIYEGDAVNQLINTIENEEIEKAKKEAKEAVNEIEKDVETPFDVTKLNKKDIISDKINSISSNLTKNRQEYERRKLLAKERYQRRKNKYKNWKKGNLSATIIPFQDTIVLTANSLLRSAEVGAYKFKQFIDGIKDIYDDIDLADMMPTLKLLYIQAVTKYSNKNPNIIGNLSSIDEVISYQQEPLLVIPTPDEQSIPLYRKMLNEFDKQSQNVLSQQSSHYDIMVNDGTGVKIYNNKQAVINSLFGTENESYSQYKPENSAGINEVANRLRAVIDSEENFRKEVIELAKVKPDIDVEFYVLNRNVPGMPEAIARKRFELTAQQSIRNGIKVRNAVISILLGKPVDPSLYPSNFNEFKKDILELKDKLEALGLHILNTEQYIYGTLDNGDRVASQVDIIAADENNKIWVIDVRSGGTPINRRLDKPGYYGRSSIRSEVSRGLELIEKLINSTFGMLVLATYLLPVIYNDYSSDGIRVDKVGDEMLVPFKQTRIETYDDDINVLKSTIDSIVDTINDKINLYNLYADEANKYTNRFSKLDNIDKLEFNTVEECQRYILMLSIKESNIDDLQEDISTTILQTRELESEALESIESNYNINEILPNLHQSLNNLISAVKELDLVSRYIPEVRITTRVEAENVKAIYVALFDAQMRLNDFLSMENASDIDITAEEECIAAIMEKMAEHPESFGRENVFVRKWWLNNFIFGVKNNSSMLVRNQFEQYRGYVQSIDSWVNTLHNHVIGDLDNHRELLKWYSSVLNNHFSKLLDNAEEFANTLDSVLRQTLLVVIAKGRNLILLFNNTWGIPTDDEFPLPPADELERISRMPVRWMDKYGISDMHSPATDAMLINSQYWRMSLLPDFLDNMTFNFYVAPRDRKYSGPAGEYTIHKGDVAVYILYMDRDGKPRFADLPFKIDISNYKGISNDDILRLTLINRGNVLFTEKVKEMLNAAKNNPELKVSADVSLNKGEIKYDPIGTINKVTSFLFAGLLNLHNIHSITVSTLEDIGVLCVQDDKSTHNRFYEIRTGSKLELHLSNFNEEYDKDDPEIRSGLLIYMYKTGNGLKIGVPMSSMQIGPENALKIAKLIHRYILGERTVDGFDILLLLRLRVYIKDPSKHLSVYNNKNNMIEFVGNGIEIGGQFYDLSKDKQAIIDRIALMLNATNITILNKQLISSSDGVFDVAYSKLNNGESSVLLPNGFVLTIENFRNNGTWFGYLLENNIIGTRAASTSYRLINFGNPYFVKDNGEKLHLQKTIEAPTKPSNTALSLADDPFAGISLPMTIDEDLIQDRDDDQVEDFRKNAIAYFERVLGDNKGELKFDSKQDKYIKKLVGTQRVMGLASTEYTRFSLYAPYHAILHEAFHRIMELLLPEDERNYFYSQYRKRNGNNLTSREVAEGLCDIFIDFLLNKEAINKNLPFYKKLIPFLKFCKFMIGQSRKLGPIGYVRSLILYRNINAGKYKDKKYQITKEANERFKKEFGEELFYTVKNQNDNRSADFLYIADSGLMLHMVAALGFYIMETKRLSDPNPDVDSIIIDETTPSILESQDANGKSIIDNLCGTGLSDDELTMANLAFREVLEYTEKEVKNKKGEKVGTARVYPKFAAISDKVSLYISNIYGEQRVLFDDTEVEDIDDSGENVELQGMGNDAWDKAAYEINKLDSVSKKVKLFLGTIPYVTRDAAGNIIYDTTRNIYGVPMYMPMREVYNTVVHDLYNVKSILEFNDMVKKLAKVNPMYDRILNKFRLACKGMWTRNDDGSIAIDYDKEAFAIQIVSAISSQEMDFIIASSKKDADGGKAIRITKSFLGRDIFKLPGQWTKNVTSGQIGIFSRYKDQNGNLIFADKKLHPNGTDIFSKTADFIHEMQVALSMSGERTIDGVTYNVDLLEDISKIKHELVKRLHNIGIIVSDNMIDYMLLNNENLGKNKTDRDLGKRGLLNWLTWNGEESIKPFIDLLRSFVRENGLINQEVAKKGYLKNGFVADLAKWESLYKKSSIDQRALALNGKELNMISLNNSISKRCDSINTHDLENEDIRKILQYGYNVVNAEKPYGSIIAKRLLEKDPNLSLKFHVYLGFKTDNKGDMGQEYVKQATIDDYMAKFTMLLNGYMIFPALADKGTWGAISGVDIPGMLFITAKIKDEDLMQALNTPTIKFFNKEPYIVPPRNVLVLMLEYMKTERLAILRCMADLGYKDIPGYEDEGRVPIPKEAYVENYHTVGKQGVEPNGTRFLGLTLITVKENGKLNTYVLNNPKESSVDLLKLANDKFFNLSEEDQLEAIVYTLHAQTEASIQRAIDLGIVERVDKKAEWIDKDGNERGRTIMSTEESLMNLDSKHLNLKQIDALTNALMKSIPHSEFGTWSGIPTTFEGPTQQYISRAKDLRTEKEFCRSIARSLAVASMINDVMMRSIISTEESLRVFIGNPAFFAVLYDMQNGIIKDSAYDMLKRIGGLISTGEDNVRGLPYADDEYTMAEIEDYKVSSSADIVDRIDDMFVNSMVRDVYGIVTNDWVGAYDTESVDKLIEKAPESLKERLNKIKVRAVEYAQQLVNDIDVADGAAYITDEMCETLLRRRGAYEGPVIEAFLILRNQSTKDNDWTKKREAYSLIYDEVNIVPYKYTAYGFRDHTVNINGIIERVSDLTVPYYDKYAIFPLFKGIATGGMGNIYDKMLRENVQLVSMHSGVKVGSMGPVKYDGNFINDPFNSYRLSFSDIRRQLSTEPEEGDRIPVGTQMVKIALQNLRTRRLNYVDVNTGKNVSGDKLLDNMMNHIKSLSLYGAYDLMDEFFYEGTTTTDEEKLGKYLAKQLADRNASNSTIEACRLVKSEGDEHRHMLAPLAATVDASWIESILISHTNKKVIDIDLPGSSYIQRSAFAMEGKRKEGEGVILNENEIDYTINNGNKLQFLNEDGSMDAVISMDYFDRILFRGKLAGMSFEEKKQWLLDHNIIGENAKANTIGYRIPTQADSSIHALRFVDVVPAAKTTIILPEEFVTITGADYDIDHLYLVSYNYNVFVDEDGTLVVTTTFNPSENPDYANYYHQNGFIDCLMTMLKDSENSISILYRSVDSDTVPIKTIANKIPDSGSTKHLPYNFGTLHEQVLRKSDYLGGKFGIAPIALNITSQLQSNVYEIPFRSSRFTKATGIDHLHHITDADDIYIDSWLSGFLNAHVDIVKDNYISKLNVNEFTYNTLGLLVRTGFGSTAVWFLAQPIIRDMSAASNRAKSRYAADLEFARSPWAAEQYLIQMAISKYISEENLSKENIKKYTTSNDKRDILARINVVNYIRDNEKLLEEIATHPNATKVTVDGVEYNVADVLRTVFYAWKALEKYSKALSNFIHFSKIDTRKHGKTLIEIQRYMDGYLKLYFPSEPDKSVFDVGALQHMAKHSWIDIKTRLAINLPCTILSNLTFDANPNFVKAVFNFANYISTTGGALNVEVVKKLSRHLRTAIKSQYFVDYAQALCKPGQTPSDYIRGLFLGSNCMSNRLIRLKHAIENNPIYYRLSTNQLINQIDSYVQDESAFAFGREVEKPGFITLLNNADNSKINSKALEDAWEDLLRDEDLFVRGFAKDLILYAFFSSGEFKGWDKILKYVPFNWIMGMYNPDFKSYAQYIREALLTPVSGYSKYMDIMMSNLASDSKIVRKIPIKNSDGTENFIDGNQVIKFGKPVDTFQEADKYIMVRVGNGYQISDYGLFKLVDYLPGGPNEEIIPIYARMKIRGYNYQLGMNIYEYGFDLNYGENGKDAAAGFDVLSAFQKVRDAVEKWGYAFGSFEDLTADALKDVYYGKELELPEQIEDNGPINIWFLSGENPELSNFANRPFDADLVGDGSIVTYNSVELAFQLSKLKYALPLPQQPQDVLVMANNPNLSPYDAKRMGDMIEGLDRDRWDTDSRDIMKDLIKKSFLLNPAMLDVLLNTGNRPFTHTLARGRWLTEFPEVLEEVRRELLMENDNSSAQQYAREIGKKNRRYCEGE